MQSQLWKDLNACNLLKYGSQRRQYEIVKNTMSELKEAGLNQKHFLCLELLFPLSALSCDKEEILSILLQKSVLMKDLVNAPNVRLLNNKIEIIEFLKESNYSKMYIDEIRVTLKLSIILFPEYEHECVLYLKRLLLETERIFIQNGNALNYKANICAICQRENIKDRCSRCQSVYYCNKRHQREHWQVHKKQCNSHSKRF